MMKSNKFFRMLSVLCCLLLMALPLAGCSGEDDKDTGKVKIGILQWASHPSLDNCYNGLIQGLEEAGYKNGETAVIDYQNAMNTADTASQLAKNMVAKQYDILIGIATPAAQATYSAASEEGIPAVFCAVSDPVGAKLVNSLEKPGINSTGTSDLLNVDGQLRMIRAFQPDAKKLGILYTTSEANSIAQIAKFEELAGQYGLEIVKRGIQDSSEVAIGATSLAGQVDCITNLNDNNVVDNLSVLLEKANEAKIPVYGSEIEQVKNGCLASESLDYVALGKRTGEIAARVLKGEKAAEVAVGLVDDSQPVVNTDVAAAFALTIPEAYASAEKVNTSAE